MGIFSKKKEAPLTEAQQKAAVADMLQVLASMSSKDMDALEQIARGNLTKEVVNDENVKSYLGLVASIFGRNQYLEGDLPQTRIARYEIYDEMDDTIAYASSALDIISDDATQPDDRGYVIKVRCENEKVQTLCEDMLKDQEVAERVSKWARVIAKYGDFFVGIDGEKGKGITRLDDTTYPGSIERKEVDGHLVAFQDVDKMSDVKSSLYAPWEFVHFRHKGDIYKSRSRQVELMGKDTYKLTSSYGQSILKPAVKVYAQLRFVENIIILSRLTNSIRRNIFMVNVGDVAPDKSYETIQNYANLLKKDISLDLEKGMYDSRKKTINYDEDIFIPVSDPKNDVRIEQVGGDVNITEQYDLEYLLNKLFASLKIPKAYLNYEQDLNARSTLVQLDIRYARSVARLQQTIVGGLVRMCKIHLAYNGIDPRDVDLEVTMTSVSSIDDELKRAEREENNRNAKDLWDTLVAMNKDLGEASGKATTDADGNEAPPSHKIDLEYAAYHVLSKVLDLDEDDISKLIKFEPNKDEKKQGEKKVESKIHESRKIVYYNADLLEAYPDDNTLANYNKLVDGLVAKAKESEESLNETK